LRTSSKRLCVPFFRCWRSTLHPQPPPKRLALNLPAHFPFIRLTSSTLSNQLPGPLHTLYHAAFKACFTN